MAFVFGILALICTLIIIVDAFKKNVLKGFGTLLCWIYAVYYGVVEFEHEYKWLIVIGAIVCGVGGGISNFIF